MSLGKAHENSDAFNFLENENFGPNGVENPKSVLLTLSIIKIWIDFLYHVNESNISLSQIQNKFSTDLSNCLSTA